jgi:hypothetical protein
MGRIEQLEEGVYVFADGGDILQAKDAYFDDESGRGRIVQKPWYLGHKA